MLAAHAFTNDYGTLQNMRGNCTADPSQIVRQPHVELVEVPVHPTPVELRVLPNKRLQPHLQLVEVAVHPLPVQLAQVLSHVRHQEHGMQVCLCVERRPRPGQVLQLSTI